MSSIDSRVARLALRAERARRGSEFDPLRLLMDPTVTGMIEHPASRTDPQIPGKLHPKQVEALTSDFRHKWCFWANQSGKTTYGAIEIALYALGRHPNQAWDAPLVIWASALTWDLWETILLPELLTWLPADRIIDAPSPRAKSMKRTIKVRADNGTTSLIIGKSAEQGAAQYQSARVHVCWLDEEHPASVWDEIQPRLVRFGGRTICTATPLLGMTWLYHRIYEPWKRGLREDHFCSHAGVTDNPAITPERVEALKAQYAGDRAQLEARLYGHFTTPTGIALRLDPSRDLETWAPDQATVVRDQEWTHVCGVDFGYWRFAFVHAVIDRVGRAHVVGEIFSQKENLETRAKRIDAHLDAWYAPPGTRLWGDAANPTDILEINREFARIGSPYRVRAVRAENKARSASVTLLNNLLHRNALLIRRDLGDGQVWRLGRNAASDGTPQIGSRLLYEIGSWRYPSPRDGQAQKQDPDDDTADGADCVAALRYLVMSHFRTPEAVAASEEVARKYARRNEPPVRDYDHGLDKQVEQYIEQHRREQQGWERW